MNISNTYDVSLFIGKVDLLDSGNASNVQFAIEESIYDKLPTCKILFASSTDFVDNLPIVDGTKIKVIITSQLYNIKEQFDFRVMKVAMSPSNNNMLYSVEGVIDFYELFRDPIKYSMNNNSSELFKFILSENGLGGKIYQTQDKQLWVPSECNLYQWLNYVSQHAWASQQSGYFWCLDKSKNLSLIDIDRAIYQSKNVPIFEYGDLYPGDQESGKLKYKNISINMNPGIENLFNKGYDGENNHFDLLSYSIQKTNANKVRAVSEIVNINKELSSGLSKNMLQFDVGNHHKNFFLAEAQNRRILSTFSTYVDLFCDYYAPIRLAQVCTLSGISHNAQSSSIKTINIKYIVSKIITKISSSKLIMDVELCSQGYNDKSTESY